MFLSAGSVFRTDSRASDVQMSVQHTEKKAQLNSLVLGNERKVERRVDVVPREVRYGPSYSRPQEES